MGQFEQFLTEAIIEDEIMERLSIPSPAKFGIKAPAIGKEKLSRSELVTDLFDLIRFNLVGDVRNIAGGLHHLDTTGDAIVSFQFKKWSGFGDMPVFYVVISPPNLIIHCHDTERKRVVKIGRKSPEQAYEEFLKVLRDYVGTVISGAVPKKTSNPVGGSDDIEERVAFSKAMNKKIKQLKKDMKGFAGGVSNIKVGYRGTGSKRGDLQIFIRFKEGGGFQGGTSIDLWLGPNSLSLSGVLHRFGGGDISTVGKTPDEVYRELLPLMKNHIKNTYSEGQEVRFARNSFGQVVDTRLTESLLPFGGQEFLEALDQRLLEFDEVPWDDEGLEEAKGRNWTTSID